MSQTSRNDMQFRVLAERREEASRNLRTEAENKLLTAEVELQKLRAEKIEWENKEKDYRTMISTLVDRLTDSEAECHQLQNHVDDQEEIKSFRLYLASRNDERVKELENQLEHNKWNLAKLTRTAIYLRDKADRTL